MDNRERALVSEIAKHYTVHVNNPDYPEKDHILKGWSQCICGEAKANGTTEYKYIWAEHIEKVAGEARAAIEGEPCPDGLLPDGSVCPRCGGKRAPSGIDGGTWVHVRAERVLEAAPRADKEVPNASPSKV